MPVSDSARTCWIAAAIAGLLVWISTSAIGSMRWYEGLVLGGLTVWILGSLLVWIACKGPAAMDGGAWQPPAAPAVATAPAPVAMAPVADAAQPLAAQEVEMAAEPDDLKRIKGIGPKLEEVLHAGGVTRFAQIAAWDDAEIDRFAELIGRMGSRIRSDDWVGQARDLAAKKGGAA